MWTDETGVSFAIEEAPHGQSQEGSFSTDHKWLRAVCQELAQWTIANPPDGSYVAQKRMLASNGQYIDTWFDMPAAGALDWWHNVEAIAQRHARAVSHFDINVCSCITVWQRMGLVYEETK
tara:strand:+ start:123 stop:485 length:363 start_codon:yes stop_codon:yes gene_type:complete